MNKCALLATASAFALLAPLPVGAVTLDWSAPGFGSGTITATNNGSLQTTSGGKHYRVDTVTGITGTFQGFTNLALLPAGSAFSSDNKAYIPPYYLGGLYLDFDGVSFSYDSGQKANLYGYTTGAHPTRGGGSSGTQYLYKVAYGTSNAAGSENFVSANVSAAATPLPASLPLFAGGAGVIGLVARRRKKKKALAPVGA